MWNSKSQINLNSFVIPPNLKSEDISKNLISCRLVIKIASIYRFSLYTIKSKYFFIFFSQSRCQLHRLAAVWKIWTPATEKTNPPGKSLWGLQLHSRSPPLSRNHHRAKRIQSLVTVRRLDPRRSLCSGKSRGSISPPRKASVMARVGLLDPSLRGYEVGARARLIWLGFSRIWERGTNLGFNRIRIRAVIGFARRQVKRVKVRRIRAQAN